MTEKSEIKQAILDAIQSMAGATAITVDDVVNSVAEKLLSGTESPEIRYAVLEHLKSEAHKELESPSTDAGWSNAYKVTQRTDGDKTITVNVREGHRFERGP